MCSKKVPVFNRKDGQYHYYPCGKCVDCLNNKALKNTRLLQDEFKIRPHALMVTLKYRNADVPLVKVVRRTLRVKHESLIPLPFPTEKRKEFMRVNLGEYFDYDEVRFIAKTERLVNFFGKMIHHEEFYSVKEKLRCDKLLLPVTTRYVSGTNKAKNKLPENHLPILFFPDVQRFMKKIRQRIFYHFSKQMFNKYPKKLSYEEKQKVRSKIGRQKVFMCGEYGPQSLRPHYHLTLHYDSSEVAEYAYGIVRACWTYGSCTTKYADSGSSRYVAEYCNSLVSLPKILQYTWNKARCFKSVRLGVNEDEELTQDVRKVTYEDIRKKLVSRDGKYELYQHPMSVERYLYPRTYRFDESNDYELLVRYELYSTLGARLQTQSITKMISMISHRLFSIIDYPLHNVLSNHVILKDSKNQKSTLYRILQISKRFIENCKQYNIDSHTYLKHIKRYYDDKNKITYTEYLRDLSIISNELASKGLTHHLINYYDNVCKADVKDKTQNQTLLTQFALSIDSDMELVEYALNHEEKNIIIQNQRNRLSEILDSKKKHKELYDNLKIFEYE